MKVTIEICSKPKTYKRLGVIYCFFKAKGANSKLNDLYAFGGNEIIDLYENINEGDIVSISCELRESNVELDGAIIKLHLLSLHKQNYNFYTSEYGYEKESPIWTDEEMYPDWDHRESYPSYASDDADSGSYEIETDFAHNRVIKD